MSTSAIIVDDEPLARQRIRDLLASRADIVVAGEAGNGRRAVELILAKRPAIVLLDIQMPGLNGFEVLEAVSHDHVPVVVFVTAYDEYAVKAFDVHALDYLLKPFDPDRFHIAIDKAISEASHRRRSLPQRVHRLLQFADRDDKIRRRLPIRDGDRLVIVEVDRIDWIEAAGNYVNVHVGRATHLKRATMKRMEKQLASDDFVRIHRRVIVNINRVKELKARFHGDYSVILTNGHRLPLSRRYLPRIKALFEY